MACVGITVKPPSKQPDAMLALSKHEVVRAPELKDIAGKRMWQATVEIIGSFKQTCHETPVIVLCTGGFGVASEWCLDQQIRSCRSEETATVTL